MSLSKEIERLLELGRLPNENDDIPDGFLEEYEQLLALIKKPVSREDAAELVKLFPDISCFGLEWTILHLIESCEGWPIDEVINSCPSAEWKNTLCERVSNKTKN
jgi:hypothetical protein